MNELNQARITALNAWIDGNNVHLPGQVQTWARVAKVAEESGEAIAALIGTHGTNPRKGFSHSLQDVEKELLDTAVTALEAVEHLHGGDGMTLDRLWAHLEYLTTRVGLDDEARKDAQELVGQEAFNDGDGWVG